MRREHALELEARGIEQRLILLQRPLAARQHDHDVQVHQGQPAARFVDPLNFFVSITDFPVGQITLLPTDTFSGNSMW